MEEMIDSQHRDWTRSELSEEKYVVFKMADYERIMESAGDDEVTLLHDLAEAELGDFVVIRLQDRFAAPALHEYANSIQTLLDFLKEMDIGAKLSHLQDVSEDEWDKTVDHLVVVRDYFHSKAQQSEGMARKLPD